MKKKLESMMKQIGYLVLILAILITNIPLTSLAENEEGTLEVYQEEADGQVTDDEVQEPENDEAEPEPEEDGEDKSSEEKEQTDDAENKTDGTDESLEETQLSTEDEKEETTASTTEAATEEITTQETTTEEITTVEIAMASLEEGIIPDTVSITNTEPEYMYLISEKKMQVKVCFSIADLDTSDATEEDLEDLEMIIRLYNSEEKEIDSQKIAYQEKRFQSAIDAVFTTEKKGSFKMKAELNYKGERLGQAKEVAIEIQQQTITFGGETTLNNLKVGDELTKDELEKIFGVEENYEITPQIYESTSDGSELEDDDKALFIVDKSGLSVESVGSTYLTIKYESKTELVKDAQKTIACIVAKGAMDAPSIKITPKEEEKLGKGFSIEVTYTFSKDSIAKKYMGDEQKSYFQIEAKEVDGSNIIDLEKYASQKKLTRDGKKIKVQYEYDMPTEKELSEENMARLDALYAWCAAPYKVYATFEDATGRLALSEVGESSAFKFQYDTDNIGLGEKGEYDFSNAEQKLEFIGLQDHLQDWIKCRVSIVDDQGVIEILDASKGTFVTRNSGSVRLQLDFVYFNKIEIRGSEKTIVINSPEMDEDFFTFNGKTWNQLTQIQDDNVIHSYKNDDAYWFNKELEISVNADADKYYNSGKYVSQNEIVATQVPATISSNQMLEYTFTSFYKEAEGETSCNITDTLTHTFGIDTEAPRAGILNETTEGKKTEEDMIYFSQYPSISQTFSDAESGMQKIVLTGKRVYFDEQKCEKTQVISETVSSSDSMQYEFQDGRYSDVVITAYDNVGNITESTPFEGKDFTVDTEVPEVTIIAKTADEQEYTGENWTNQKITYTINSTKVLSGIKSVEYAYVPYGKTITSNNWTSIPCKNTALNEYEFTLGKEDFAVHSETVTYEDIALIADAVNAGVDKSTYSLKNGKLYFRAVSKTGKTNDYQETERQILLEQRDLNDPIMYVSEAPAETGWYNEQHINHKPYLRFAYSNNSQETESSGEYHADLELHYRISSPQTSSDVETTKRTVFHPEDGTVTYEEIDDYTVEGEGIYEITIWSTDKAGNKSNELKYQLKADYTAPTDVKIYVAGEDATRDAEDSSIHFTQFFDSSVEVTAEGNFDISGFNKFVVYEAHRPGDKDREHSFTEENGSFSIGPNTRCFLYAEATDIAGNMTEIRSEGFVVDNEAPTGASTTELTITPQGANKNGFFNDDFDIDIEVSDSPTDHNSAALKQVSYVISDNGNHSNTETLYSFGSSAPSSSDLENAENFSDTVTIKAADFESNTAYIEVTGIDNSGNERVTMQELQIDVTLPEITITYDNNQALHEHYYQQNRTARVEVKELNFDPELVTFKITKDGQEYAALNPSASSWTDDGDVHYTNIVFAEDGDYTLTASCTDLADNEAIYDTVDSFTIDKTQPEVTVSYDNETPWKDIYFNAGRTATITIVEHNFDASDFSLTAEPIVMLSNWSHNGDTHRATISFTNDGEYTYGINYVDLAGNEMAPFTTEHFKIDTVEPIVTISGVEDKSANAGTLMPVVTVEDEDFDAEGVTISLRTSKGKEIALTQVSSAIPNGNSYSLPNVTEQADEIYYLTVEGTDLAGNTSELTYRFSLNRNGSTYDLSSMSDVVERVYSKYSVLTDLKILEMNVDKIEKFSIYISRNGIMLESEEVSSKPSNLDENVVYYHVEVQGSDELGYSYVYTIYQDNFMQEGTYNIMFYSKDRAGNEVNNTLNDKGANITFIVDNTVPKVVIEGIDGYELYAEDSKNVNVYVTDNFKLQNAEFYLVDINGQRVQTWNYMDLVETDNEIATLTIPSSETRQSLLFSAVDAAGNEITALQDEEGTPTNFLITTNVWLRFLNTPGAVTVTAAGTSVLAAGVGTLYVRKRKKLKVVNAKEK